MNRHSMYSHSGDSVHMESLQVSHMTSNLINLVLYNHRDQFAHLRSSLTRSNVLTSQVPTFWFPKFQCIGFASSNMVTLQVPTYSEHIKFPDTPLLDLDTWHREDDNLIQSVLAVNHRQCHSLARPWCLTMKPIPVSGTVILTPLSIAGVDIPNSGTSGFRVMIKCDTQDGLCRRFIGLCDRCCLGPLSECVGLQSRPNCFHSL
jgi:hypothetical protein